MAMNLTDLDIQKVREFINKTVKPGFYEKFPDTNIEEEIRKVIEEGSTSLDIAMLSNDQGTYCDKCGNCCRVCSPIQLCDNDILLMSHKLGTKKVMDYITHRDDKWWMRYTKPCKFLKDDKCSIYEYRPIVCRQFPLEQAPEGSEVPLVLGVSDYCNFTYRYIALKVIGNIISDSIKKNRPDLQEEMERLCSVVMSGIELNPDDDLQTQLLNSKVAADRLKRFFSQS